MKVKKIPLKGIAMGTGIYPIVALCGVRAGKLEKRIVALKFCCHINSQIAYAAEKYRTLYIATPKKI